MGETTGSRFTDAAAGRRTMSWLRPSPVAIMFTAMLVCLAAAAVTLAIALQQPWLGVRLEDSGAGVVISSVARGGPADQAGLQAGAELRALAPSSGAEIAVAPVDLVEDPDGLETYGAVQDFLARQQAFARILAPGPVMLEVQEPGRDAARSVLLDLAPRPLTSLPVIFWIQLGSGLAGCLIGAWVWSIRRTDLSAGMFALSGFGLMVSALTAAIYSTRELALDGTLFARLSALNHLGVHLFGGAMIALFLVYPRRLVPPLWLLVLPAVLLPIHVADVLRLAPDPATGLYAAMLAEMLLIVVLVAVQWRLARGDPATRAALRWLGLSVVVGAGAFVAGIGVPLVMDAQPSISQGYAFAFFLLVYGGIALGIRRYRLFDLGDWAFRVLFYTCGAMLILLLDASLVWIMHLESGPALGVALLLVGFGYMPLRDALWRRVYGRTTLPEHALFAAALEVAFAVTRAERTERWHALLARFYDPLELAPAGRPVPDVTAADDGLELCVPPVAGSTALRLRYPFAGKGLFTPRDAALARQLVTLVAEAEANRDAYNRGVREERQRIARDLHDDVGARLMTGLHASDARTRPLLHAALSDIRAIVAGLNGEDATLARVLADARHECARRLEAANIGLSWPPDVEGTDALILDYRRSKALTSSLREMVSNVIRHAGATAVTARITLAGGVLSFDFADNGRGLPREAGRGHGLINIRRRIEEIGGRLDLTSGPDGTCLAIALPVVDAAPRNAGSPQPAL